MILRWLVFQNCPRGVRVCASTSCGGSTRSAICFRRRPSPACKSKSTNWTRRLRRRPTPGKSASRPRNFSSPPKNGSSRIRMPIWRENVEVLLVALAVAMAIRTFFVQPFKIPTGSMQPTLYGVTSAPDFGRAMAEVKNFSERKDFMDSRTKSEVAKKIQADIDAQSKLQKAVTIPTGWQRVKDWVHGISYIHVVAQSDGVMKQISPMTEVFDFQHQAVALDWRSRAHDLVSAGLRRIGFAEPRGFVSGADLSQGRRRGEIGGQRGRPFVC